MHRLRLHLVVDAAERRNYSVRIHTDCPRIIPGYVTNMGVTILLDDFTEENGATWYLPGSHTGRPRRRARAVLRDGDRLNRAGGIRLLLQRAALARGGDNLTERWRHALTINGVGPI